MLNVFVIDFQLGQDFSDALYEQSAVVDDQYFQFAKVVVLS
jgi:hypothetical protein